MNIVSPKPKPQQSFLLWSDPERHDPSRISEALSGSKIDATNLSPNIALSAVKSRCGQLNVDLNVALSIEDRRLAVATLIASMNRFSETMHVHSDFKKIVLDREDTPMSSTVFEAISLLCPEGNLVEDLECNFSPAQISEKYVIPSDASEAIYSGYRNAFKM